MPLGEVITLYYYDKLSEAADLIAKDPELNNSIEGTLLSGLIYLKQRKFERIDLIIQQYSPEMPDISSEYIFKISVIHASYYLILRDYEEFRYHLDRASESYFLFENIWMFGPFVSEYFRMRAHWSIMNSKFVDARYILETAIQINRSIGNLSSLAINYKNLGHLTSKLGSLEISFNYYLEAISILDQLESNYDLIEAYSEIGNILSEVGNISHALDYYNYALMLIEEHNELRILKSQVLMNIGNIAYIHGKLHEAMNYFLEAREIKQSYTDLVGLSKIYLNLGRVIRAMGDLENALDYFITAQSMDADDLYGIEKILIYNEIIFTNCKLGRISDAKSLIGEMTQKVLDRSDEQSMLILTFAKSMIMKYSDKLPFHLAARNSFLNLFENENLSYDLRIESLFQIIELDLNSTDHFIPPDRLKLEDLLNMLYKVSQQNSMIFYLVHVLIIKARLAYKKENHFKARLLKTQAQIVSIEHGIGELVTNYYKKYWDELLITDPSFTYSDVLRHELFELISLSI